MTSCSGNMNLNVRQDLHQSTSNCPLVDYKYTGPTCSRQRGLPVWILHIRCRSDVDQCIFAPIGADRCRRDSRLLFCHKQISATGSNSSCPLPACSLTWQPSYSACSEGPLNGCGQLLKNSNRRQQSIHSHSDKVGERPYTQLLISH